LLAGFLWTTLIDLAAFFLPFAGSLLLPLTPLPVLYFYLRKGRLAGLTILALSWGAVFGVLALAGAASSMPLFLLAGLAGAMLGEFLIRDLSIEEIVLYPVLAFFTAGCLLLVAYGLQTGQEPFAIVETYVADSIRENLKIYGMLGLPPEQVREIEDQLGQIARFFAAIAPAFAIAMAVLALWLNVLSAEVLILQRGGSFPDLGDLTLWKAPDRVVWFLIGSGGMLLATSDPVRQIGLNVLILCAFIYLFQGLAITACFFKRKRVPLFFRYLFYGLVFAQQYVALTVSLVGLADLWIDLRKYIGDRGNPA